MNSLDYIHIILSKPLTYCQLRAISSHTKHISPSPMPGRGKFFYAYSGRPPVPAITRAGFGHDLIEEAAGIINGYRTVNRNRDWTL